MTREEEIKRNMQLLEISFEEATQLYEDDHSDEILPEVKEIETKAKAMKRRYEKDTTKTRKPAQRNIKPDLEKIELVDILNYCLLSPTSIDSDCKLAISNVQVTNKQKEIIFNIGENEYSITLTKHRKKKAS